MHRGKNKSTILGPVYRIATADDSQDMFIVEVTNIHSQCLSYWHYLKHMPDNPLQKRPFNLC